MTYDTLTVTVNLIVRTLALLIVRDCVIRPTLHPRLTVDDGTCDVRDVDDDVTLP